MTLKFDHFAHAALPGVLFFSLFRTAEFNSTS
jgi:hypothetical protein